MEPLSQRISFSKLPERYEIEKSTLSHRIKSLGLKLERRGRNAYLSVNQVSILDDLNEFLKEEAGRTIEQFKNCSAYYQTFDDVSNGHQTITFNQPTVNKNQNLHPVKQPSNIQSFDIEPSNVHRMIEQLKALISQQEKEIEYLKIENEDNNKTIEKIKGQVGAAVNELCHAGNDLGDAIILLLMMKKQQKELCLLKKKLTK